MISVIAGLLVLTSLLALRHFLRPSTGTSTDPLPPTMPPISPAAKRLVEELVSALPSSVILPSDPTFIQAKNKHWSAKEYDRTPSCIVRPRDTPELCAAVKLLKRAFDEHGTQFAVRSGGHSPVLGAASSDGGVVIDMSLFNQVRIAPDGQSVEVGSGCRWGDVSRALEPRGLGVVGGRSSDVGVGGLLLGGGISFFSPRYGLAANNIISYALVLASGTPATASASQNPTLWRALKGGSNNFAIATHFTLRSFPAAPTIWSGFLYLPSFQEHKVLAALHSFLARNPHDESAAGPMACFTWAQPLGFQAITVHMACTEAADPSRRATAWPRTFATSGFQSLFRVWSTCRARTLREATDEMERMCPRDEREAYATTTIRNDAATIAEAHRSYVAGIAAVRHVRNVYWTLVLQPLLPGWVGRGDENYMGLRRGEGEEGEEEGPLVLVSYTVSWKRAEDDGVVHGRIRESIGEIEAFARERGTGHRYRFQNYCGEWQRPFEGYGEEGLRRMREVSRKYDPDGLFQRGCIGGFKLGVDEEKSGLK